MTPTTEATTRKESSALRRTFALLRPHRRLLVVVMVLTVLLVAVNLVVPSLFGQAVDAISDEDEDRIIVLGIAVIVAGVVAAGLTGARQLTSGRLAIDVELTLRDLLYGHLLELDSAFYRRRQVGQAVSLLMVTSGPIRTFLAVSLPRIASDFLTFVFAGVAMALIDFRLAFAALWPIPIVVYLVFRFARVVTPALKARQEATADVTADAEESLRQILSIDVLGVRDERVDQFEQRTAAWWKQATVVARTSAVYDAAIQNLPNFAWAGLFLWGGLSVINSNLELSALVTFLGYVGLMLAPVANLGGRLWQTQNATASAQRVYEVLDERPEISDLDTAAALAGTSGALDLRGVTKSFDGLWNALDGVELSIGAGRNVAIVGRTGSGKSALLSLISRIHDPEHGHIEVDGQPIDQVLLASLRSSVREVGSVPHVFPGTVMENLTYGADDVEPGRVDHVVAALGLRSEIDALSSGFDTVVGDGGEALSITLAQSISIARALVTGPDVLLLDDVTAPFPPAAEARIVDGLRELTGDVTVVAVAGRPALVALADDVVVMDKGELVAFGSFDEVRRHPAFLELLDAWRLDLGDGGDT